MKVQTSPGNHSNVKVFGDNNYAKALEFHEKKSPVKMRLTYNDTYNNYQLSDRDVIQACNRMEVDFQYDTNIGESSTTSILSKSMKIKELKTMSPDNTYYSIKGTVILGKEPPAVLSFGPLKEDVVIVDLSAYIRVKVYGLQVYGLPREDLVENVMTKLFLEEEGHLIEVTAPKTSLATVVGDWTDDNTIAAALFNLRNVKLTYSVVSKLLLHLSTDEGQAKEGEEMRSREEEKEIRKVEENEEKRRKEEHERDKQQRNNEEDV